MADSQEGCRQSGAAAGLQGPVHPPAAEAPLARPPCLLEEVPPLAVEQGRAQVSPPAPRCRSALPEAMRPAADRPVAGLRVGGRWWAGWMLVPADPPPGTGRAAGGRRGVLTPGRGWRPGWGRAMLGDRMVLEALALVGHRAAVMPGWGMEGGQTAQACWAPVWASAPEPEHPAPAWDRTHNHRR